MEQVKNNFELDIINSIKSGMKIKDISTKLNISMPNLSYHLNKLKTNGTIKKIGYGLWEVNLLKEVQNLTKATNLKVDSIRGHAFIWKVRFKNIKLINWKYLLDSKEINYDEIGLRATPRIILNNRKIWLGKKHIIIYEPESSHFFGDNAIESRKLATYSLLSILANLESLLGIKFKGIEFTPAREHFSLIKNVLAVQCNKNREKINVYNEKGYWLSIDDSLNLGELETLGSMENKPMDTNLQVQKWWNENKETQFKVSPNFILESFNKLNSLLIQSQSQLLEYRKQNAQHLKLIQEYRKENIAWRKNQVKIISKIYNENKQTQLNQFLMKGG